MGPFDLTLDRALADLRARLVADATAAAAGGRLAGGIRRAWRGHVESLARVQAALAPPKAAPPPDAEAAQQ